MTPFGFGPRPTPAPSHNNTVYLTHVCMWLLVSSPFLPASAADAVVTDVDAWTGAIALPVESVAALTPAREQRLVVSAGVEEPAVRVVFEVCEHALGEG